MPKSATSISPPRGRGKSTQPTNEELKNHMEICMNRMRQETAKDVNLSVGNVVGQLATQLNNLGERMETLEK